MKKMSRMTLISVVTHKGLIFNKMSWYYFLVRISFDFTVDTKRGIKCNKSYENGIEE